MGVDAGREDAAHRARSGARSREVDIAAVGVRLCGEARAGGETAGSRGQGRATRRGEGGEEGGQERGRRRRRREKMNSTNNFFYQQLPK